MEKTTARTRQQQYSQLIISAHLDYAKISTALVDERGRVIADQKAEMPQRTTRAAVATITNMILGFNSVEERGSSGIGAIGISVSGLVDPLTGRVSIPGLRGWTRVALRQMVDERLSDSGLDLRAPLNEKRARAQESNTSQPEMVIYPYEACAAAAESWCGAVPGKRNVVYVSLGEDITAGILVGERVLQGASGLAGAAGWLGLSESFKQEYVARGCLASEATMASLTRRAIEEWGGNSSSILSKLIKTDATKLDAETIIRAARGGDALARRVVDETCRWIGRGIANLLTILNPDAVVIGGKLGIPLKPFLDEIRDEVQLWAPPESSRQCRIVNARLGEKAGLLGAARLAWLKSNSKK